jgi:hypothetical protein
LPPESVLLDRPRKTPTRRALTRRVTSFLGSPIAVMSRGMRSMMWQTNAPASCSRRAMEQLDRVIAARGGGCASPLVDLHATHAPEGPGDARAQGHSAPAFAGLPRRLGRRGRLAQLADTRIQFRSDQFLLCNGASAATQLITADQSLTSPREVLQAHRAILRQAKVKKASEVH